MRMKLMKPVPNMSQGTEESCPCAYGMYRLDARPMQGLNLNQDNCHQICRKSKAASVGAFPAFLDFSGQQTPYTGNSPRCIESLDFVCGGVDMIIR